MGLQPEFFSRKSEGPKHPTMPPIKPKFRAILRRYVPQSNTRLFLPLFSSKFPYPLFEPPPDTELARMEARSAAPPISCCY